jgi:hypothetical protein
MAGPIVSTLMLPTVVLALFPAASVTAPVTAWSTPSPSVCGGLHVVTVDESSPQSNVTVTSCRAQEPGVYGRPSAVFRLALIVGAVVSAFIGPIVTLALFPAIS